MISSVYRKWVFKVMYRECRKKRDEGKWTGYFLWLALRKKHREKMMRLGFHSSEINTFGLAKKWWRILPEIFLQQEVESRIPVMIILTALKCHFRGQKSCAESEPDLKTITIIDRHRSRVSYFGLDAGHDREGSGALLRITTTAQEIVSFIEILPKDYPLYLKLRDRKTVLRQVAAEKRLWNWFWAKENN